MMQAYPQGARSTALDGYGRLYIADIICYNTTLLAYGLGERKLLCTFGKRAQHAVWRHMVRSHVNGGKIFMVLFKVHSRHYSGRHFVVCGAL